MEAGLRLLLEWGFGAQGLQTVVWRATVGNWASRKLAWRLGFRLDGVLRHSHVFRGGLVDAWTGTLLAGEPRQPTGRWLHAPVLEGGGVRLRPFTERDLPRVVEACSDPVTQHWLGRMPSPYTDDDARAWLDSHPSGWPAAPRSPGRSPTPRPTWRSGRSTCSTSTTSTPRSATGRTPTPAGAAPRRRRCGW